MDIFFNLSKAEDQFVVGFSSTHITFPLQHTFHYVGVRFLPAVFPWLFRIDASELSHRWEPLEQVLPGVAQWMTPALSDTTAFDQIKAVLDAYFLRRLEKAPKAIDSRLFSAFQTILQQQGRVNVEKDLDAGISSRQLRRLFNFYIGDSPKTFSKVVRFQNLLGASASAESLRKDKPFYDAGYYDQAHFIKEFKLMAGLTPSQAFKP